MWPEVGSEKFEIDEKLVTWATNLLSSYYPIRIHGAEQESVIVVALERKFCFPQIQHFCSGEQKMFGAGFSITSNNNQQDRKNYYKHFNRTRGRVYAIPRT